MIIPHFGHPPIPVNHRERTLDLKETGDFAWEIGKDGRRAIVIMLPDRAAKNLCSWVRFSIGWKNRNGYQWEWDGEERFPSLFPYIVAPGQWQGVLTNGRLLEYNPHKKLIG